MNERLMYLLISEQADNNVGMYPASTNGQDRTAWQDGWNACKLKRSEIACAFSAFIKSMGAAERETVLDLLERESIGLHASDPVTMYVNCSDLFFWACADCEEITVAELPELVRACSESPSRGSDLWCCRKRGMRPQKACYRLMSDADRALFDACGPERPDDA